MGQKVNPTGFRLGITTTQAIAPNIIDTQF